MESELIFVGYRSGVSKNGKKYFMLNFITTPVISDFTEEDKYNNFIKSNDLLSICTVPFELQGNRVIYYL